MSVDKKVKTIPATLTPFTSVPITGQKRRKVAGYARVSTDHDEQFTSYEAQIDYYTKFINAREDWEFVKVYTDEGITGTSTRHREGFKQMIADALAGRIDLIVTKSVSRFARNTVDSLSTIRQLKDKGVEVYFEKENIWTFDGKGELLITIMSSLAQEESRSISENCTWGQRKRFSDGKVTVPFTRFLGYDRGPDGNLVVNEEQATIVRRIYQLFLSGKTPTGIATLLTREGVKTPAGKEKWSTSTVRSILTNEKYKGDALLQKSFTTDFLTKKTKINEGEIPQYYVENNHEAIIDPEVFEMVQVEFERRSAAKSSHGGLYAFSHKIKCGECGSWYGSKVWHSNNKYRRTMWQCNHKFEGEKCSTPSLTEEEIREVFLRAANKAITEKDEIIATYRDAVMPLLSTDELEHEKTELESELNVVAELIEDCIRENAHVALDQAEYQQHYDSLVERFDKAKARHTEVSDLITERQARRQQIEMYLEQLQKRDLLTEFRDEDWFSMVDYMTVAAKDDITVKFKDGTEIRA